MARLWNVFPSAFDSVGLGWVKSSLSSVLCTLTTRAFRYKRTFARSLEVLLFGVLRAEKALGRRIKTCVFFR